MSWLSRLLGINEINERLDFIHAELHAKATAIDDLTSEVFKLRNDFIVTYRDEYSKDRKQLSDELGARAMQRLSAEDKARKLTTGELYQEAFPHGVDASGETK